MIEIREARFPDDLEDCLAIFREYVNSPSVSLAFQNNDVEFANLPAKYAPPDGRIILAFDCGRAVGCVAFRKVDSRICEMKRLYVRPEGRGQALGERLIEAILDAARASGYVEMRLDVLPEFAAARRLYDSFGFTPADPVSHNPVPGTAFLGLRLDGSGVTTGRST